jgi:hypothetical protein
LTQPTEVHVPADLLERILKLAGTEMILVGGQALAFWAAYYHTAAPTIAITKDVDLLGTKSDVERLARGLDAKITARAVLAESPAGRFRVMHPLDVLQGRLENVHGLSAKQDEHGVAQLRLAIEMVQKFVGDIASQESSGTHKAGRPIVLRHLARIETLSLSDAGRKVAKRYGVHVADAIDPAPVRHIEAFVSKKLPQLLKLMSAARRAELQRPDPVS